MILVLQQFITRLAPRPEAPEAHTAARAE
jgi:hypothetical protein